MLQIIRNTERKRRQLETDIARIEHEYDVIQQVDAMLERTKCYYYEQPQQVVGYSDAEKRVRLQISLLSLIIFQICSKKTSKKEICY